MKKYIRIIIPVLIFVAVAAFILFLPDIFETGNKPQNDQNNDKCNHSYTYDNICAVCGGELEYPEGLKISTYDGYSSNKTSMLTYDEYGRFICYATIWTENNAASQRYLVMLFQKDLTFSILEPQSIFSYQEELAEFKRANNWHCE